MKTTKNELSEKQVNEQNSPEIDHHEHATEASTLQLKPGEWSETLTTDLGNKQPFLLMSLNEERAKYIQSYGCLILIVFND